jgi:hypothetical protein
MNTPILLSDLIEKLSKTLNEKGDLPVFVFEDVSGPYPLQEDSIKDTWNFFRAFKENAVDCIVLGVY